MPTRTKHGMFCFYRRGLAKRRRRGNLSLLWWAWYTHISSCLLTPQATIWSDGHIDWLFIENLWYRPLKTSGMQTNKTDIHYSRTSQSRLDKQPNKNIAYGTPIHLHIISYIRRKNTLGTSQFTWIQTKKKRSNKRRNKPMGSTGKDNPDWINLWVFQALFSY